MKLVKLSSLFDITYGVNLELSNLEQIPNGLPFVSRTEKNNGVSAFVREVEGITPNPEHTLSVALGGSVLACFYQKNPYYSGRDLAYLTPKHKMTELEMIIFSVYIQKNKYRYNYGRQANKTLKEIKIPAYDDVHSVLEKGNLINIVKSTINMVSDTVANMAY